MPTFCPLFAIIDRMMNNTIRRVNRTKDEARTSYDRLSRWYDLISGDSEARPRQAGLELLDAHPGENVLDIGPGTGHSLAALAHSVRPASLEASDTPMYSCPASMMTWPLYLATRSFSHCRDQTAR